MNGMAGLQIFAVDRSARIPILKAQADKVRWQCFNNSAVKDQFCNTLWLVSVVYY